MNDTSQIYIMHFVRSLQKLVKDSNTKEHDMRASSPDLMASVSQDDFSALYMEGETLDEVLNKIPEQPPNFKVHDYVRKFAEALDQKG